MRTYEDTFSGAKIYPGRGKIYVRGDSKIFRFQNGKSESLFLQHKNPRQIAWTVLARRQNRKGITQEQAKARKRRAIKSTQRGFVGMDTDVIKERRALKPAARAADKKASVEKAKELRRSRQAAAKQNKGAAGGNVGGAKSSKMGAKGAAPKPMATSR